eukprot:TRINITY_DN6492_c0_g1_i2.p1 TRINITY_DN6492_c0_g1~~TRINITY_DN6492_c0_g1_i2.p1  ORF type:complete len:271 (+),score=51.27 TRINITY_DN6492_c0_g1_i2:865-1677(+)
MPSFLTPQCKDLIKKILVVNPVERLTMDEIREHDWFKENLPKYLNIAAEQDDEKFEIDEKLVSEISSRMGVPASIVVDNIHKSIENSELGTYYIAYQLLKDSEHFTIRSSTVTTREQSQLSLSLAELSSSPAMNLRSQIPFLESQTPDIISKIHKKIKPNMAVVENSTKRKIWYLGIMSTKTPYFIMEQVLLALKTYHIEWKVCGPYQLRCRNTSDSSSLQFVKFGIQLFALPFNQNTVYFLDLKIIQGQVFDFFGICCQLMNHLKNLDI